MARVDSTESVNLRGGAASPEPVASPANWAFQIHLAVPASVNWMGNSMAFEERAPTWIERNNNWPALLFVMETLEFSGPALALSSSWNVTAISSGWSVWLWTTARARMRSVTLAKRG